MPPLPGGSQSRQPAGGRVPYPHPTGMEITTHTPKLESLRREILALYLEADEDREFQADSRESEFTTLLARYGLRRQTR